MDITFESLLDRSLQEITALANRAFAGYVVDVHFEPPMLAGVVRTEAVDLAASRRVVRDGADVGIALIARRGWTARVAAMAICPEARRQGIGRALMERVIEEARARGEKTLTLEVIEQNPAAIRLYEATGFRRVRRLVGYACASAKGVAEEGLEAIDVAEAAREVIAHAPGLPWQLAGETLTQMGLPSRGYRLGPAVAVISNPAAPTIVLRALCVPPEQRRTGWARRLIQALRSRFPDKSWRISIIAPEDAAPGFFMALGFERESLSQFQMELSL